MVFTQFASLGMLVAAVLAGVEAASPIVHPSVHRALREQGGFVNVMVTLRDGVDGPINAIAQALFPSRDQKLRTLVDNLTSHAKASQKALDAVLTGSHGTFKSEKTFWISNQKVIKAATPDLIQKLATLECVLEIREEQVIPVPRIDVGGAISTVSINVTATSALATTEYGVTKVGAPSMWTAGYTGKGVVVGSIDTGVLATHEALASNWRSSNGWFDPTALAANPYDDSGHGTHTMGTIVGQNGIGVAPGATWIACRACTPTGCTQSDLLACAQFMTCPTDAAGNNKDCTKAPRIVSNSWGGGQGNTFFSSAVSAWQAAGIIPIFANGNAGPNCKTANSPGDYPNVIGVGATDSSDVLASFSSKGPSVNGLLKPDISAPGVNVRSVWNTGTANYNTISGTSMATPHVSGVVALLLSKKSSLTYAQVKTAITSTADKSTLKATGYTCGNTRDGKFPNNQYGSGRINAFTAGTKV